MAVFAKVVDLNGFTAAARSFGVPKAAISRAVAELEAMLGVKLLLRTTRRIALTPAGRMLYPACRRLLDESEGVARAAAGLREHSEGPLQVLADAAYGRVLLSPLVPRFLEKFPRIPLTVSLGTVATELPVGGESWDVLVRAGATLSTELVCRELGTPPMVLCATPGYLQKHPAPTRPEELAGHAVLAAADTGGELRLQLRKASQRAEVRLQPKLAVNDPALIHASTAAGLGVGLMPEFLCRQGLATHKLVRVLAEWQLPAGEPYCAIYPVRLAADARVTALVDFLAANLVPALAGAD
ncbi:MAG: LysR family transcriptional regulator [Steroidobacteraceae bacterium]